MLDKEFGDEHLEKREDFPILNNEKLSESSCIEDATNIFVHPKEAIKHRSYTIEKKLEVVNYAKSHSTYASARHFGIDRKMIASWKKQEQELIARKYFIFTFSKIFNYNAKSYRVSESSKDGSTTVYKRLSGAGRQLCDKDLDERLAEWVKKNSENNQISRRMIQLQALRMSNANSFRVLLCEA
jgi:hypothetical protein